MPTYPLKLVTVLHLEHRTPDFRSLPCRVRSHEAMRAERERWAKEHGRSLTYTPGENHDGVPVGWFQDTSIPGKKLQGVLGEPRVIHTPDEPAGRAKWKVEFRPNWRDDDREGLLDSKQQGTLSEALGRGRLKVKALWVNPDKVDPANKPQWANLVLVVQPDDIVDALPQADFRLVRKDGTTFVQWSD